MKIFAGGVFLCALTFCPVLNLFAQDTFEMKTLYYTPPMEQASILWQEMIPNKSTDTPAQVLIKWNFSYDEIYINGGVSLTLFKRKYILKQTYLDGPYSEESKSFRPLAYFELFDVTNSTSGSVSLWPSLPLDGTEYAGTLNLADSKTVTVKVSGWKDITFEGSGTGTVKITYQKLHSAWVQNARNYCKDYLGGGSVQCLIPQVNYSKDKSSMYGFAANSSVPVDPTTDWPSDYIDCAKREADLTFRPKVYSLPLNVTLVFSTQWSWWLHAMTKDEQIAAEYEQSFSGVPSIFQ